MCPVNLFPYVAGLTVGPLWRIFRVSTHTQLVLFVRCPSPNVLSLQIILWYLGMCLIITVFLNFYWRFQVWKVVKNGEKGFAGGSLADFILETITT